MFIDSLFFILIIYLFIIILIAIAFYRNVRIRTFYTSNTAQGAPVITGIRTTDGYHPISNITGEPTPLEFIPLQEDDNKNIYGRIVLLTHNVNPAQLYKARIMNSGSQSRGEFNIEIGSGVSYTSLYFNVPKGNNRSLTIQLQEYNSATNTFASTPPSFNLIQAYAWYI